MEQYLSVGFSNLSCGLYSVGSSDEISVEKIKKLIDVETSKIKDSYYGYEVGHTYICKDVWVIKKGYKELKIYFDEEDAKAEYNRIVDEICKDNRIINLK